MLKRRLILALTINDGQLYRTKRFVPDRSYSLDFVDLQGADEIVVLDVTPPGGERAKFLGVVEKLSQELFLPLAVGGHVRDWEYARDLMNAGADKIVLNAFGDGGIDAGDVYFEIADRCVQKLGSSSVVGRLSPRTGTPPKISLWAAEAMIMTGIGELLLQSESRDGSLEGYDLDLIGEVSAAVSVPVIAMSGCGTAQHMVEGFEAGASACATSNIFAFTPSHVRQFKNVIERAGIAMRPVSDM